MSKEQIRLEDGRKAERIVSEVSEDGVTKKITEILAEPAVELKLYKREIEHSKPVVYKKETELVDADGNVIEKKVETTDTEVPLQLREHLATSAAIKTQSVEDCDCSVTREELKEFAYTFATSLMANQAKDDYSDVKENPARMEVQSLKSKIVDNLNIEENKWTIILFAALGLAAAFAIYAKFFS